MSSPFSRQISLQAASPSRRTRKEPVRQSTKLAALAVEQGCKRSTHAVAGCLGDTPLAPDAHVDTTRTSVSRSATEDALGVIGLSGAAAARCKCRPPHPRGCGRRSISSAGSGVYSRNASGHPEKATKSFARHWSLKRMKTFGLNGPVLRCWPIRLVGWAFHLEVTQWDGSSLLQLLQWQPSPPAKRSSREMLLQNPTPAPRQ